MHWILLDPFKINVVINVPLINAFIVINILLRNIWLKWFNILMHILFTYIGKWEVWVWVDDICGGSSNSTRIPSIFRSILLWKSSVDFLIINEWFPTNVDKIGRMTNIVAYWNPNIFVAIGIFLSAPRSKMLLYWHWSANQNVFAIHTVPEDWVEIWSHQICLLLKMVLHGLSCL